MTSKKAIYILLGLIIAYVVIRFVVSLFKDDPNGSGDSKPVAEISFPVCKGPLTKEEVKAIQSFLNKNMQGWVKAPLVEDGVFGGLTESELQAQTGSVCVSKSLYQTMV